MDGTKTMADVYAEFDVFSNELASKVHDFYLVSQISSIDLSPWVSSVVLKTMRFPWRVVIMLVDGTADWQDRPFSSAHAEVRRRDSGDVQKPSSKQFEKVCITCSDQTFLEPKYRCTHNVVSSEEIQLYVCFRVVKNSRRTGYCLSRQSSGKIPALQEKKWRIRLDEKVPRKPFRK